MANAYTLITPSAVTANGGGSSASIGANGKITFSTCTSLNIDDCWSSTYDTYYLVMRATCTVNNTIRMRLRLAGTDRTTSTYEYQLFDIGTVGAAARGLSQTEGRLGGVSTTPGTAQAWIAQPALAAQTTCRTRVATLTTSSSYTSFYHWKQTDSDAFDGLTIYPSSGSISGSMLIYGLTK